MSNTVWLLLLVGLLTVLGSLTLLLITVRYYWGERGTPPLVGEERRRQREQELRMRVRQFEHSERNPHQERSGDFFDNRKKRPSARPATEK